MEFIDQHVRQQSMTISEKNRTSLSMLFVETEAGADVCGIAAGGSRALVLKINTLGEHAFPDTPVKAADLWNFNAGGLSD